MILISASGWAMPAEKESASSRGTQLPESSSKNIDEFYGSIDLRSNHIARDLQADDHFGASWAVQTELAEKGLVTAIPTHLAKA
jgi:hypothetical protein